MHTQENLALAFDCKNSSQLSKEVLMKLIWGGAGGITLLKLFKVEEDLFRRIKEETMDLVTMPGQVLDETHPTVRYVSNQDREWIPKPGGVTQFSLLNSADDVLYNEDDHHWSDAKRKFNSRLEYIPRFVSQYFGSCDIQNFRVNSVSEDAGLGLHREKIIGIPGRESDFKLRFHLPLVTSPGVRFLMDGQEHQMEAGYVYLFNQSSLHGVHNSGTAVRVHLVWDIYLNTHVVENIIAPAVKR